MNIKEWKMLIGSINANKNIKEDVIVEALKEGLIKAYRKHIQCPDAVVRIDIDEKTGEIHLYQIRTVVEEAEDPDLEYSLDEAQELRADAKLGDTFEEEGDFSKFARTTVTLVKNVMQQKIKEASKQAVYDNYIDKVFDMVEGKVEQVEDKFVLVNLEDKVKGVTTTALMPKSEQIAGERYYDGQLIKVIIKSVSKESKGAQVVVSRSNPYLIKRLFENEVEEVRDGTVEIKKIAREANERTKMAVYSKVENVDAIGACIGPKGSRVMSVINSINLGTTNGKIHENIDILEWSENYVTYAKNVLKPAEVIAVVPNDEENSLLVVVNDAQLSLAIGKKGINARLAVKMLDRKVDIKTESEAKALGIDYMMLEAAYIAKLEATKRKKAEEEVVVETPVVEETETVNEVIEEVKETVETKDTEVKEETKVEETVNENKELSYNDTVVTPVNEVKETPKKRKANLEKIKASNEYISKFESLADASKNEQTVVSNRRKKNQSKEDLEELENKKRLEELKKKEYEIKPEYTDEEYEEFDNYEEEHWYDDEDEYDDEYEDLYDK